MSRIAAVFPSLSTLSMGYLNSTRHPTSSSSSSSFFSLPSNLQPFFTISYPILSPSLSSSSSSSPSSSSSSSTSFPSSSSSKRIPQPQTLYGKGPNDIYFVISAAITFTLLRAILMKYVFNPFARWYLFRNRIKLSEREELKERKKREHTAQRFAEQSWSFFYCSIWWSLGATILSRLDAPFSPPSLWQEYPHNPIPGLTKFYYLSQLGWWFHQIYVINTEKRRHDHWQMFSHHILTITLIIASYAGNFTRVGTVIHTLMDFCDISLPLAKMFRYLSLSNLCDITFVFFLISWLITRQIGLAYIIRTTIVDAPKFIPNEWSYEEGRYLTTAALTGFVAMLTLLLCLATVWFYMALMVAVRVLKGQGAEDSRSSVDEQESVVDDDVTLVEKENNNEIKKGGNCFDSNEIGVKGEIEDNGVKGLEVIDGEYEESSVTSSPISGTVTPKNDQESTSDDGDSPIGAGVGVIPLNAIPGFSCKRDELRRRKKD